jgi:spermidine synthase
MKPTIKLAEAKTPEGETMELSQHDQTFFIKVNGQQLMTSFSHGSEEELGRMAVHPFRSVRQPVILIGGLGLGFTLRAVTQSVNQTKAKIIVAEIVPEVLEWNRTYLKSLHPGLWDDDRVEVKIQAVQSIIALANEEFHAILLDVDNGPSAFSGQENDQLYLESGLKKIFTALKPGGLLAVWSAYKDERFSKKLRNVGFDVSVVEVPAAHKGKKRRLHKIWLAKKGEYVSPHIERKKG